MNARVTIGCQEYSIKVHGTDHAAVVAALVKRGEMLTEIRPVAVSVEGGNVVNFEITNDCDDAALDDLVEIFGDVVTATFGQGALDAALGADEMVATFTVKARP